MRSYKSEYLNRRSSERFALPPDRQVYFQTIFDGFDVSMLVENLSTGGALLMCPGISRLEPGMQLSNGVLILSESETPRVDVVVRWQMWPRVGVQFADISLEAASQIADLLDSLS